MPKKWHNNRSCKVCAYLLTIPIGNWLSCLEVISPQVKWGGTLVMSPEILVMSPKHKSQVAQRNKYLKEQTFWL